MKLFALGDLHVNHKENREGLQAIPAHPDDWLVLCGDLGETTEQLEWVFRTLGPKWARLLWVPGNHELWTVGRDPRRGEGKYAALVDTCREHGVSTPDDPWPVWPGEGPTTVIALLFLLYDYSFGPAGLDPRQVVAWAREDGIVCVDEQALHPDPFATREAWCADRIRISEERLRRLPADQHTVLVNHWPLRLDLVRLFRIPRFVPWCGTRRTEDWHLRYRARVVVSGHLHMRATDWRDGVRFEEVALGYPRHWRQEHGVEHYLREILPGPVELPPSGFDGPRWHR